MNHSIALAVLSSLALAACSSGGGNGTPSAPTGLSSTIVSEATKSGPASPQMIAKLKEMRLSSEKTLPDMDLVKGQESGQGSNTQKKQDKLDSNGRQWLARMRQNCSVEKSPENSNSSPGTKTSKLYIGGTLCPVRYSEDKVETSTIAVSGNIANGAVTMTQTQSQAISDESLVSQSGMRSMNARMNATSQIYNYNIEDGSGTASASGTSTISVVTADQLTISADVKFESLMSARKTQMAMIIALSSPNLGTLSLSIIIGPNAQPEFRVGGRVVTAEEFSSIFGDMADTSMTAAQ